jgi:hypothetical protein
MTSREDHRRRVAVAATAGTGQKQASEADSGLDA